MPCVHFELLLTYLVDVEKSAALYVALAFNDPKKLMEREGGEQDYSANRRKLASLLGAPVVVARKEDEAE